MVLIASPPPVKPPSPLFRILTVGSTMLRIFDPTRHGTTALTFRYFGPIGRFDHQRPLGDGGRSEDSARGISYTGLTLSCCLVECFGDTGVIEIKGQQIARIVRGTRFANELTRNLTLLDLRGNGAMRAGAVAALAKTADRNLSQAWSRYFYEQTSDYGLIDGISYLNAHNDEEAIALYERSQSALICPDTQILPLDHQALRPAIQDAALANHLDFLPLV